MFLRVFSLGSCRSARPSSPGLTRFLDRGPTLRPPCLKTKSPPGPSRPAVGGRGMCLAHPRSRFGVTPPPYPPLPTAHFSGCQQTPEEKGGCVLEDTATDPESKAGGPTVTEPSGDGWGCEQGPAKGARPGSRKWRVLGVDAGRTFPV